MAFVEFALYFKFGKSHIKPDQTLTHFSAVMCSLQFNLKIASEIFKTPAGYFRFPFRIMSRKRSPINRKMRLLEWLVKRAEASRA